MNVVALEPVDVENAVHLPHFLDVDSLGGEDDLALLVLDHEGPLQISNLVDDGLGKRNPPKCKFNADRTI